MTAISREAEQVVLEALADPSLPRNIRVAINDALSIPKSRKSRVRTAITVARDPTVIASTRIAAFQVLVDFLTGEEVLLG